MDRIQFKSTEAKSPAQLRREREQQEEQLALWCVAWGGCPRPNQPRRTECALLSSASDAMELYNEKCDDPSVSYRGIERAR